MPRSLFIVSSFGSALLLLTSCIGTDPSDEQPPVLSETGSSVVSSSYSTRNVSFIGTISDVNPSIYQEGSHTLLLEDGQFIFLRSTDANLALASYLGKHVEVRGTVRPTVEGSGEILSVEEVTVLELYAGTGSVSSSASSARKMCGGIAGIACDAGLTCVDDPSDSCDPLRGGADCSGMCVPALPTSSASPVSSFSSSAKQVSSVAPVASSAMSVSSSVASVQSSASPMPSSGDPQVAVLAKQNYADSSLWTQQYCTSHIGFCVPAHKNWYFKSFGATTTNLWHVEFSASAIESLHSGAIVLNLVSGTSASMNAKDGQIQSRGSDVVGFKDWTGGNHFELIADASLKDAVSYMLSHIASYSVTE